MSRIGKVPVTLPDKVEIKIDGGQVHVKGPKGQLEFTFSDKVGIELKDKKILVTPKGEGAEYSSLWGTTRALVGNMVIGVSQGFTKKLEFSGVGYRASVKGSVLQLNLGYSHPIHYQLPEGITAKVAKNIIELSGIDKAMLGLAAAKVRSFRPPNPYKGKGIKYVGEVILRKAGKTGAKGK